MTKYSVRKTQLQDLPRYSIGQIRLFALASVLGLGLAGCGPKANDDEEMGEVVVAMTDAEGDFMAYEVEVDSIVLHRVNGTVVETLPNSATIDFAQYTNMTELLSSASVPTGTYDEVEIRVDYSNSNVLVQDADGNPIEATVVDGNGEVVSEFTLTLGMNQPLVVAPGIPAHLTIDFDLDSSNQISDDLQTVTVEPVLIADAELVEQRDHRVRGLLVSVDSENSTMAVDLRPFRFRDGRFGEFSVTFVEDTQYEIDGVALEDAEAIAALEAMSVDTPITVQGTFTTADRVFTANEVLAGSSVPWSDKDVLKGAVTKRVGDQLWISGGILELDNGTASFGREIEVVLSTDTLITKAGRSDLGNEVISIGSRIQALGDFVGAAESDSNDEQFNAEAIRILKSQLKGKVKAIENSLTVDLYSLNKRRPIAYDFAGTGADSDSDANASEYQVDTSVLELSTIDIEESVAIRGYASDFGAAPYDFNAETVAEFSLERLADLLHLDFRPASSDAISNLTENGMTIEVEAEGLFSFDHLRFGHGRQRLNDGELIDILSAENGHYVIKNASERSLKVYRNFADFSSDLQDLLDSELAVSQVHGGGHFDSDTTEFTANKLVVVVKNG